MSGERRRSWRTEIALECTLHRKTGKVVEGTTLDLGPGGMRVKANRPMSLDETFEFELPDRARINGRARVVGERGYRVYALRFDKLGDEARAELALLAKELAPTPPAPTR
ncbi:PilZ domain-containing protein [Solirubrobacter phytolaccae]|uniref:PilZ domain-containing protein n=1 Tax=Solirubrobacter phytolaccae TaxID=1404360 RepID=A0A9X3N855_9ACTN|nr:PilZ domain-containing protein [Solirubrobacter phytolaccae]MDA0181259.1 PilZ domain-containing protein [Solirubrobacter phytolaccae]